MKTAEQLVLPLPVRTAQGRDDFFVAPCNALAVQQLDNWENWPNTRLALVGPKGAGKTHLAHVWAEQTGAKIIDALQIDPDQSATALVVEGGEKLSGNAAAQENLFHLYNASAAQNRPLLLTGQQPPARWKIELPDLVSRLSSIHVAHLDMPDDVLLNMIFVKLFADRQVDVGPDLISYLVKNTERSYAQAIKTVALLDKAAFSHKRPLTARFAKKILMDAP